MRRAGAESTTEQAWGLAGAFVDEDQAAGRGLLRQTSLTYMAQLDKHGSVTGPDGKIPKSYELHADEWWKHNVNHSLDVLDVPSTLVGHPDKVDREARAHVQRVRVPERDHVHQHGR